jgi:hypothetical protein
MFRPIVPSNVRIHWYEYQKLEDISEEIFEKIRTGFAAQRTENPLVSFRSQQEKHSP